MSLISPLMRDLKSHKKKLTEKAVVTACFAFCVLPAIFAAALINVMVLSVSSFFQLKFII